MTAEEKAELRGKIVNKLVDTESPERYDDCEYDACDAEIERVWGWNKAINEVLKIIGDFPEEEWSPAFIRSLEWQPTTTSNTAADIHNNTLYTELKDKVKAWWDEIYPADIFTGCDSDDEGPKRVAEIRELYKR